MDINSTQLESILGISPGLWAALLNRFVSMTNRGRALFLKGFEKMLKKIRQWLLKRKFRKAILSMEETLKEMQEFYEFCDDNYELLSEDYEINLNEFKRIINETANGIAELDQMHANY